MSVPNKEIHEWDLHYHKYKKIDYPGPINDYKAARKETLEMYKKGIYVDRPKLKSYPKKRSEWIVKFEKRYNRKITDKNFIDKHILSIKGQNQILSKGRGAYYSSGSRPNQTSSSWAYARLASVIMGGKARKVDNKIWLSEKR